MPKLNEKFIVNLQGKDFVQYGGLVDLAHQIGIKSIETDIIQFPNEENKLECIVKAVVTTEDDKVFEDYGDASPGSVSSMLRPHIIRMASTRAKARALRDLTNVGMTAIEELGGEDAPTKNNNQFKNKPTQKTHNKSNNLNCSSCNVGINETVNTFSMKRYGKPLCIGCQKKE